ncbi:SHOCT domain-containing protein [Planococcus sp. CPCC 101016]|uniref:SHOCT domain-containing protein n=1 Tax=Planococcus sp. CPCC 101016 TaxID=2599617 RepID=UPI001646E7F1|nr:SHOCT domain-containing protein [Planococcus sp. CPCC 101016]
MKAVDVNSLSASIPLYLWMLLFLVFLVIAFIGLVIYTSRKGIRHAPLFPQNQDLELLKKQYANGEISKEEFQKRIKEMENQSTRP